MNHCNEDRLDRWLDSALNEQGKAEPRAGLEARVLANLAAMPTEHRAARNWWPLAVSTAIAVASLALWLAQDGRRPEHRAPHGTAGAAQVAGQASAAAGVPDGGLPITKVAASRARSRSRHTVQDRRQPQLKQFPAARPLSEQEQLLKAYVNHFPNEAAVIAREQEQRKKEIEALYADATRESDSDQER